MRFKLFIVAYVLLFYHVNCIGSTTSSPMLLGLCAKLDIIVSTLYFIICVHVNTHVQFPDFRI